MVDGDAAQLVDAISDALGMSRNLPLMTMHRFMVLQRVAFQGGQTVARLLARDKPGGFDEVLDAAYRWEMSLQELLPAVDIARGWADPTYRDSLSEPEKSALPPHPSGDVTLEGTPLEHKMASRSDLGFSTLTLRAICCSTGDLPCTLGDTSGCTQSVICFDPPPPPKTEKPGCPW
jgi:mersacidin/lichenicidin family type 2 lantibiotic